MEYVCSQQIDMLCRNLSSLACREHTRKFFLWRFDLKWRCRSFGSSTELENFEFWQFLSHRRNFWRKIELFYLFCPLVFEYLEFRQREIVFLQKLQEHLSLAIINEWSQSKSGQKFLPNSRFSEVYLEDFQFRMPRRHCATSNIFVKIILKKFPI